MIPIFIMSIENEDDRNFIAELYENYYPIMKKKAYFFSGDYTVVDDLINDAFVKLIDKISILRALECCKRTSYIVFTIKHISINYGKQHSIMGKKGLLGVPEDLMEIIPDDRPSIEELFSKKEEYKELLTAVQNLTERDRDLLNYKYNLELSDKKISEIMSIPVNNIREYLVRARRRVLKNLERKGVEHV